MRPRSTYSLPDLDKHPACTDAERTRPVCALKPSGEVNASKPFRALPVEFRYVYTMCMCVFTDSLYPYTHTYIP